MAEPRTRSRTGETQSKKAEEQEAEKQSAADREAEKKAAQEAKEQEKKDAEAKARQSKIESGDLIEVDGVDFEKGTKETKVFGQVADLIAKYQESDNPLIFTEVCGDLEIKYPEDLVPAMHALETVGKVTRYDARRKEGEGNRRTAAYKWTDGE